MWDMLQLVIRLEASASLQDNDADPIPRRAFQLFGWRVFQCYDPEVSRVKLKTILKILPNQYGADAGATKLFRGKAAIPITLDNHGARRQRIAILREGGIQKH